MTKRKLICEKKSLDEGHVAASLIKQKRKQLCEKDVARAAKEDNILEGTEEQRRKLGTLPLNEVVILNTRQKANEDNSLNRIKEASIRNEALKITNFRGKVITKNIDGMWWNPAGAKYMALYVYIPQGISNALRSECIEWVHAHPFTCHVGLQGDFINSA